MRFSRATTVVLLLVASALAQQQTPAASQQTKDNQNAPAQETPQPGDYALQLIITDKLAKAENRVGSQWIDFESGK